MNPEVKTLESGIKLAKFSLATNDSYVNTNGEKIEETEKGELPPSPVTPLLVAPTHEAAVHVYYIPGHGPVEHSASHKFSSTMAHPLSTPEWTKPECCLSQDDGISQDHPGKWSNYPGRQG